MFWFKWAFRLALVLGAASVLHYVLPQRDVVRIIDAYEKRQDFGWNRIFWASPDAGTSTQPTRDVRFIDTVRTNGKVMVYRNEDTNFAWPFYFKFDSSNVNAEAKNLISTQDAPIWVAIRHYGWRIEYLTIYPNATSIKVIDSPDVRLIPWFNIVFLITAGLLMLGAFRLWQKFKAHRIDPLIEDMSERWETVDERTSGLRATLRRWAGTIWQKIRRSNK